MRNHRRVTPLEKALSYSMMKQDPPSFQVDDIPPKGRGIRATEEIRKGDYVLTYFGEYISTEEGNRREENCSSGFRFFYGNKKSGWCVDATEEPEHPPCLGRLVNHSTDSKERNCVMKVVKPSGFRRGFLCLFATRDIEINEEILYDYGVSVPWEEQKISKRKKKTVQAEKKIELDTERFQCKAEYGESILPLPLQQIKRQFIDGSTVEEIEWKEKLKVNHFEHTELDINQNSVKIKENPEITDSAENVPNHENSSSTPYIHRRLSLKLNKKPVNVEDFQCQKSSTFNTPCIYRTPSLKLNKDPESSVKADNFKNQRNSPSTPCTHRRLSLKLKKKPVSVEDTQSQNSSSSSSPYIPRRLSLKLNQDSDTTYIERSLQPSFQEDNVQEVSIDRFQSQYNSVARKPCICRKLSFTENHTTEVSIDDMKLESKISSTSSTLCDQKRLVLYEKGESFEDLHSKTSNAFNTPCIRTKLSLKLPVNKRKGDGLSSSIQSNLKESKIQKVSVDDFQSQYCSISGKACICRKLSFTEDYKRDETDV